MSRTALSRYLVPVCRLRTVVDTGVAAVFACVIWAYSFSYDGSVQQGGQLIRGWQGWHLLIPAVTVLLVGVRRIAPWFVLCALLAVDWYDRAYDIWSEPFGVAVGLFTIAGQRSRRQAAAAGVLALTVLTASTQLIDRTVLGFWTCLTVYAFGLGAGIAVRRIERYRWHVLRLAAEAQLQRRATDRAEERAALALEVHDVCSNSLAVVTRLAEVARERVGSDPGSARLLLDDLTQVARDGMGEVRRFVRLAEGDAAEGDVRALLARTEAVGVPITSVVTGAPADPVTGLAVYRVLQEALTNALRHARPDRITVEVRYDEDGGVVLRVGNDGVRPGVPGVPGAGRGTRGMGERIAALGGTLRAEPGPVDGNWLVEAVVPAEVARPWRSVVGTGVRRRGGASAVFR